MSIMKRTDLSWGLSSDFCYAYVSLSGFPAHSLGERIDCSTPSSLHKYSFEIKEPGVEVFWIIVRSDP